MSIVEERDEYVTTAALDQVLGRVTAHFSIECGILRQLPTRATEEAAPETAGAPLRVHHARTKHDARVKDRRTLAEKSERLFVKPDKPNMLGTDDSDPTWWPSELVVEGNYRPPVDPTA